MAVNEMKKEFCNLLMSTQRDGVDIVLEELGKTGFFDAPASRKDHLGYPGGLMEHSLNVYRIATVLAKDLQTLRPDVQFQKESIIITSLLHDICKATRYVKNDKGEYYLEPKKQKWFNDKNVYPLPAFSLPSTELFAYDYYPPITSTDSGDREYTLKPTINFTILANVSLHSNFTFNLGVNF